MKIDKKKLHQYVKTPVLSGLSLEQCAKGIIKLLDNAGDLLKEAELFVQKDKKERAVIFLVAALEEYSKVIRLSENAITPIEDKRDRKTKTKNFFKEFKHHKSKQTLGYGSLQQPLISNFGFLEAHSLAKRAQPFLESARTRGLYVDFEKGEFLSPKEAFTKNAFLQQKFDSFVRDLNKSIEESRKYFGRDVEICLRKFKMARSIIYGLEGSRLVDKYREFIEKGLFGATPRRSRA